ncbi:MAG: FKBP-type peptidyl-prolyl cis-trans isomerase [Rubricoccaceae bacterium]|nr:FKBP-type peptidyl-prolyl cis-trans isomerase [Rubricoccaceae bacterium]
MRLSLFLVLCLAVSGCGNDSNEPAVSTAGEEITDIPTTCEEGDLIIVDEELGEGAAATRESRVLVNYVGKLEDGTVFNDFDNVPFRLNEVVPGFREGIAGMKPGGVRTLTIPPMMAYGPEGSRAPNGQLVIPHCATLTFEIELLEVL